MVAVGFNPRTPATTRIHSVAERRLNRIGVIAPLTDSCVALRRGWFFWAVLTVGFNPRLPSLGRSATKTKTSRPFRNLLEMSSAFQVSGETRGPWKPACP